MSNSRYYNEEGLVGVILSDYDDCPWSYNSPIASKLLFDPELVDMVLFGSSPQDIRSYCINKFGTPPSNISSLRVEFIPEGKNFMVELGMGGEYIIFLENKPIFHS